MRKVSAIRNKKPFLLEKYRIVNNGPEIPIILLPLNNGIYIDEGAIKTYVNHMTPEEKT